MPSEPALDPQPDRAAEARLRLLLEAGATLSSAFDVDDGLRRLASFLASELGDYAVTYLLEDGAVKRVGVGSRDTVDEEVAKALLALPLPTLDTAGAGRVMDTGEPVLAERIRPEVLEQAAQNAEHLRILRLLRPTSSIVVPLRAGGRTFGAISISTTEGGRPHLTSADLGFMTELADRVALVATNARLYSEAQAELERRRAVEEALRERYEQLQVIYRMSQAVARADAAEEIYDQALAALLVSLGADRASILLYDLDGVLRFKAWQGLSDEYRAAVEGHSPWTRDTVDPDPIVIADVAEATDLDAALRERILGEGIRGLAFFPLSFGGGLLGKFMVYFDRPHDLAAADIELAGAVARSVAFAITRMQDQQRLRDARDSAERANEVKSQFLAVMSHELRTPLNAIMGYAGLLEAGIGGTLNETQAGQVDRIRHSADLLLLLIEEILAYAALEAGREDLRLSDVDVAELVREAAEMVEPICIRKGIELRITQASAPLTVRTDGRKVRQIVLNLLSNATKFTDTGHIEVKVEAGDGDLLITVVDTGPGIDPADLSRIFELFTQGDPSATREKGGTGLGLAVSRRLAHLLGGEIELKSRPGRGSRFALRLPIGMEMGASKRIGSMVRS